MRNRKGIEITPEITWQEITPGGIIYESGCAYYFKTGDWRSMKPVYKADNCKQCLLCAVVCPDSSVQVVDSRRRDFDFDHCKGCGICAKVCPFDAIDFIKEEK